VTVNETSESLSPVQATRDQRLIAVSVPKGTTLRHLSLLYLDRFDQPTLTAIRLLNPAITDPNHLEADQRILLPLYLRRDVLAAASADVIPSSIGLKPEHAPGETP
jgi:hypothetical protein